MYSKYIKILKIKPTTITQIRKSKVILITNLNFQFKQKG